MILKSLQIRHRKRYSLKKQSFNAIKAATQSCSESYGRLMTEEGVLSCW
ncbi:MAG: hypothetical protein ACTS7E_03230 [Arsenophonus sp. NC-CH8-MAG3]